MTTQMLAWQQARENAEILENRTLSNAEAEKENCANMDQTPIGISDDRLFHMRSVARRAAEISRELFNFPLKKQRQMFALGLLHDIGYEYATDQSEHEHIGGQILNSMCVIGWEAVCNHGDPDVQFMPDELVILNLADMQTDKKGNRVTVQERLDGIKERYGEDSEQFTRASRLVEKLRDELAARGKEADAI